MDDLEVDDELAATVVDDEGADGATAVGEGVTDALEQVALGDDGETLLDVAGLGHGDDAGVVTEVQDAVGLVDGAQHGLDNDRGRGVGDEARLLLQLAGEQVDTEVAVLASLGGDRDTDHLARATLQDEDVANADEVAGDGDGLAGGATGTGLDDADLLTDAIGVAGGTTLVADDDVLLVVVEGVQHTVGSTLDTAAERVVVTLVVVVTHLARSGSGNGVSDGRLSDLDFGRGVGASGLLELDFATGISFALVRSGGRGLVGAVVRDVSGKGRRAVPVRVYGLVATVVRDVVGSSAATVLSLSDVEGVLDSLVVDLRTFLVTCRRLTVVGVAGRRKKS